MVHPPGACLIKQRSVRPGPRHGPFASTVSVGPILFGASAHPTANLLASVAVYWPVRIRQARAPQHVTLESASKIRRFGRGALRTTAVLPGVVSKRQRCRFAREKSDSHSEMWCVPQKHGLHSAANL